MSSVVGGGVDGGVGAGVGVFCVSFLNICFVAFCFVCLAMSCPYRAGGITTAGVGGKEGTEARTPLLQGGFFLLFCVVWSGDSALCGIFSVVLSFFLLRSSLLFLCAPLGSIP